MRLFIKRFCVAASMTAIAGCAHLSEPEATLSYCDLFSEVQSGGVVAEEYWLLEATKRYEKTHGSKGSAWVEKIAVLSSKETIANIQAAVPSAELQRCAPLVAFWGTFLD